MIRKQTESDADLKSSGGTDFLIVNFEWYVLPFVAQSGPNNEIMSCENSVFICYNWYQVIILTLNLR